jgi:hypothetical protein
MGGCPPRRAGWRRTAAAATRPLRSGKPLQPIRRIGLFPLVADA